ncbi:unnamed protein product [Symbiodinium sp. KB8]|nr:unnamed protein product [Symbiodinium sp. KB8]
MTMRASTVSASPGAEFAALVPNSARRLGAKARRKAVGGQPFRWARLKEAAVIARAKVAERAKVRKLGKAKAVRTAAIAPPPPLPVPEPPLMTALPRQRASKPIQVLQSVVHSFMSSKFLGGKGLCDCPELICREKRGTLLKIGLPAFLTQGVAIMKDGYYGTEGLVSIL